MSFPSIQSAQNNIVNSPIIYQDQRTDLEKVNHRCQGILREVNFFIDLNARRVDNFLNPNTENYQQKVWKVESKGLYVLVNGLMGDPLAWKDHIDILKKEAQYDLFVPSVPLTGNGSIEVVAPPILTDIQDYITQHPGKPICLVGFSNGGRICSWIETRLRSHAPTTPMKISCLSSAHFGSSRMELLKKVFQITGFSFGIDHEIIKELSYGSAKAQEIISSASQPLQEGVIRDFEFFASTEDSALPELSSTLPRLGQHNIVHHIVHGYDHNAIVPALAETQLNSCKQWMKTFNPDRQNQDVIALPITTNNQQENSSQANPMDKILTSLTQVGAMTNAFFQNAPKFLFGKN